MPALYSYLLVFWGGVKKQERLLNCYRVYLKGGDK